MSTPTFTPPVPPQPSTKTAPEVNLLEARFGDGYTQVTRDGINHIRHKARLIWSDVHKLHAKAIVDFMVERGGDKPFSYTLPDDDTPRRWRCTKWERGYSANDRRSVVCEITEDFGGA